MLYICGLRISEGIENTMGAFFCRRDSKGEERWWLEITGKGDKTRLVPATAELIIELARYRRENGLLPFPISGEPTPLFLPIGGKQRPLTRSAVHLIVKEVFNRTASRIRDRGVEFERLANLVEDASAHWMRHTTGSNMADTMDLRHIRDNLGNSSISGRGDWMNFAGPTTWPDRFLRAKAGAKAASIWQQGIRPDSTTNGCRRSII